MSIVSPARPALPSPAHGPLHRVPSCPRSHPRSHPHPGPRRSAHPTVTVVVPARNEARNLQVVLPRIAAVSPAVHEIIVVDGDSTDGSADAARRTLPGARVLSQTRRGKGNAMACGFAAATGDVIVMFDADGSADPAEIPAFVAALVAGADFAKGSRFTAGGGSDDITLLRRTGNAGLNGVANALFGTSYTDLCYGYNAFWADLLPVLDLPDPHAPAPGDEMLWGDGFEIETVLNCRVAAAGLRITEVPSVERRRIFGESNLRTFIDGTRVLRTLAAERRRAVQRHTRGQGRLTGPGRWTAAEPFGPAFDRVPRDHEVLRARPLGSTALREPHDEARAFGPTGARMVAPREPVDAAPDPGAVRVPRQAGRPHERNGTGAPHRDRSGIRYVLEEEPS